MTTVFLLDKSTAAMSAFAKTTIAEKENLSIGSGFDFTHFRVEEFFADSLFSNALFDMIADDDNSENSSSVGAKIPVDVITVNSKKDVELFIKKCKDKEVLHKIVDSENSESAAHTVYMFTVKTKELLQALAFVEKKCGSRVSIVNTLDNKRGQKDEVVRSFVRLGLKKNRALEMFNFMSGEKNNYENVIPLINEFFYDKDFLAVINTADKNTLYKLLEVRKVQEKQTVKPPWEWVECFNETDFKGFSQKLMYFQSHYSTFYLYKRMREDLGKTYTRALLSSGHKTRLGKKTVSASVVANMREIADSYYHDLIESKNNGDRTFSELSVSLWQELCTT